MMTITAAEGAPLQINTAQISEVSARAEPYTAALAAIFALADSPEHQNNDD